MGRRPTSGKFPDAWEDFPCMAGRGRICCVVVVVVLLLVLLMVVVVLGVCVVVGVVVGVGGVGVVVVVVVALVVVVFDVVVFVVGKSAHRWTDFQCMGSLPIHGKTFHIGEVFTNMWILPHMGSLPICGESSHISEDLSCLGSLAIYVGRHTMCKSIIATGRFNVLCQERHMHEEQCEYIT